MNFSEISFTLDKNVAFPQSLRGRKKKQKKKEHKNNTFF
jgi:hypothetical protein